MDDTAASSTETKELTTGKVKGKEQILENLCQNRVLTHDYQSCSKTVVRNSSNPESKKEGKQRSLTEIPPKYQEYLSEIEKNKPIIFQEKITQNETSNNSKRNSVAKKRENENISVQSESQRETHEMLKKIEENLRMEILLLT